MKRRSIAGLLAVFLLFSLSACAKNAELQDELVIEAVGLDRQDEQILLTVPALNTEEAASSEGAPASGKITAVYQAEGQTAEEALTQLILITGKEPVYSHNRMLLIGESIYQDGTIGQAVDFFTRSFQPRANVLLAAAKGSARELLSANFSDGVIPAQISEDILKTGEENGLGVTVRLFEFLNRYSDPCLAEYLPILQTKESEEEAKIAAGGTLITENGVYHSVLDENETQTFLLLRQKIAGGFLTAEADGIPFSLTIVRTNPKLTLALQNQSPVLTVKLTCVCDLSEYTYLSSGAEEQTLQKITEAAENALLQQCTAFLEQTLQKNGLDLFLLHNRFLKRERTFAKSNLAADDHEAQGALWRAFLQNTTIYYDMDLEIRRIGQNVLRQ